MYKFYFNNVRQIHEETEMVRMFLPSSSFLVLSDDPWEIPVEEAGGILLRLPDNITDKDEGKRYIYNRLKEYTGLQLKWGILTGIRPVKMVGEIKSKGFSYDQIIEILVNEYYLERDKAILLTDIRKIQEPYMTPPSPDLFSLYIGIPFCPSRCVYCSFPSYQTNKDNMESYLMALDTEIRYVGEEIGKRKQRPETIYIGGGTPTSLDENQIKKLLTSLKNSFDLDRVREFTFEAGRPDTITESKLEILMAEGIDRISINPQSMKEETLKTIGRQHSVSDIRNAYKKAKEIGFKVINTDLIAGLPGEDLDDFKESLQEIIHLKADNITVHTLAIKRASGLKDIDNEYSYHQGEKVNTMLEAGRDILEKSGYKPYYLYRQKQMAGNLENVGYTLPGKENIYNIRIMEENQTILALGAGGISKVWYPCENRLERVPNVSNYQIYIERIDEMLKRKKERIFHN